jgi:serine/threonine protein kinase
MTASPATPAPKPQDVLEDGLRRWLRRPLRIAALEGVPLEAWSTYPIDRLQVTLDSGEQLPVIFKRLQAGEGLKGSRREVRIYRRLLAGQRFGAPALYASLYDEHQGHYWLFLEDLGEETLKGGDREDWMAAVRLLARMHGTYLGREEELRALDCLGDQGTDYYHAIAGTARLHIKSSGDPKALARFDALMAPYPGLVAELIRQPRTLVHGDIFPDNLLLQPGPRVRLIDWESAAIGLGVWDLVRLLDGWGTDRAYFIMAYREEMARLTGTVPDDTAFARTLTICTILNSLWHLAWEADACRDAEFVDWLLNELDETWRQLNGRAGHV